LQQLWNEISTKLYQQAQGPGPEAGPQAEGQSEPEAGPEGKKKGGDGEIDADYEVVK